MILISFSTPSTWQSWHAYLLRTPPRSEAFRHSGGESRLWTSATVTCNMVLFLISHVIWQYFATLYFEVDDNKDSLPGTEQNMSVGRTLGTMFSFMLMSMPAAARSTANPSSWSGWFGEDRGWLMESWESTEDRGSRVRWRSLLGPGPATLLCSYENGFGDVDAAWNVSDYK